MLIGRRAELRTVRLGLGRSNGVVLVGPAGIGKSTLASAVATEAPRPLRTGALASLREVPLLPFRRVLGAPTPERLDEVAAAVIRRSPGILVLDDLQWADPASLEVVAVLAGRVPLLTTVRTGDPAATTTLARLAGAGFEEVEIGPLEDREADRLAASLHPSLDAATRAALVARAAGNPLLIAHLGSPHAPASLATALIQRLAEAPAAARDAVERAALLGRPAPPGLLGPAAPSAVDLGLLVEDGETLAIAHPLVGELVVELAGQRAQPIRRELAASVTGIERATLLAAAGDGAAARRAALDVASASNDRRERAAALVLAIEHAPSGDLDVHHRLEASQLLTELGDARTAFELCALPSGKTVHLDDHARGLLALHAGAAAWMVPLPDERDTWYSRAIALLAGSDTAAEVRALAGSTALDSRMTSDPTELLDRAERAVVLADRLDVERALARTRLGAVQLAHGQPDWSATLEEALAIAEVEDDDEVRLTIASTTVVSQWVAGDARLAHRLARRVAARRPATDPHAVWSSIVAYAAVLDALLGDDRSDAVARWTPHLEGSELDRDRCYLDAGLAILLADVGRLREAEDLLASAPERTAGEAQRQAVVAWATAEVAWLAGRRGALEPSAAEATAAVGPHHPSAIAARLLAAHGAVEAGEVPAGPAPEPLLPAWAAAPLEWRGLVAWGEHRIEEAVEHLDAAAAGYVDHDVRAEARCRWAAGHALRHHDRQAAMDRLDAAGDLVLRTEQHALRARIHRSSRLIGERPGTRALDGAHGLSGRELEVLDLVGDGLTTGEISARLHLSHHTVNAVVAAAMRKLDAPTRIAAIAALRRRRGVG